MKKEIKTEYKIRYSDKEYKEKLKDHDDDEDVLLSWYETGMKLKEFVEDE